MASSLHVLLDKIIKIGDLTVNSPGGSRTFGNGTGKKVVLDFTDEAAMQEIAADPALKLAEMYMEGRVKVAEGDIYDLLSLIHI